MTAPLPKAFMISLGALAHLGTRDPMDYSRIPEDRVDQAVARTVRRLERSGLHPIVLSARPRIAMEYTRKWLNRWVMTPPGALSTYPYSLWARDVGDKRPAWVVKRDNYKKYIQGVYQVELVIEDDPYAVQEWSRLGLTSMLVHPASMRGGAA